MNCQFRTFRRASGVWYIENTATRQQESLRTRDTDEAERLLMARNEAHRQPAINMQIARAYLSAADPSSVSRTWQFVMDEMAKGKKGPTKDRWVRGVAQKPFDHIRNLKLVETRAEHFWHVLTTGTVSTNVTLRRLHNFAIDLNWLLAGLIPRRQWPKVKFRAKRAITLEEHEKILAGERNPQWLTYYRMLWHVGGSQTDVARLCAEDIDWANRTISFSRGKNRSPVLITFGRAMANLFKICPAKGYLMPKISRMTESDRGSLFSRRCRLVGVKGVTLHSYRYAWAERAKTAGFPERYAQEALGHKSQAVHAAYAKKAMVKVPCLEDWEQQMKDKIVRLAFQNNDENSGPMELDSSPSICDSTI